MNSNNNGSLSGVPTPVQQVQPVSVSVSSSVTPVQPVPNTAVTPMNMAQPMGSMNMPQQVMPVNMAQPMGSTNTNQSMGSMNMAQQVTPTNAAQPMGSTNGTQSMGPKNVTQSMESANMAQPMGSTNTVQPMTPANTTQQVTPANATQQMMPMNMNQQMMPMNMNQQMGSMNGMVQCNPAMYQMGYPPGAQVMMTPMGYPSMMMNPMAQMPPEITSDLEFVFSWKCCMIILVVLNYVVSFFLFEGNLITNVIGTFYFCKYSSWMMIVYDVGNGLSALCCLILTFVFFGMGTVEIFGMVFDTLGFIFLGFTGFYIIELTFGIIYSIHAVRVSKKYTSYQIELAEKSNAWKK
ncbi:hypothetical protein WA588_005677, partial [Blastocystis sp. NMH]